MGSIEQQAPVKELAAAGPSAPVDCEAQLATVNQGPDRLVSAGPNVAVDTEGATQADQPIGDTD